jgi:hypothetical protein
MPQGLCAPQVAYSSHQPLIEQRVSHLPVAGISPEVRKHALEVRGLVQDVGSKPPQGASVQFEDTAAVQHGLPLGAPQHEPGAAASRPPARTHPPAAGHPQMVPQHVTALEAEDEILPDRLDRDQTAAVEAAGVDRGLGLRVRRLDLDALAHERLQPPSGSVQGVPLGHD